MLLVASWPGARSRCAWLGRAVGREAWARPERGLGEARPGPLLKLLAWATSLTLRTGHHCATTRQPREPPSRKPLASRLSSAGPRRAGRKPAWCGGEVARSGRSVPFGCSVQRAPHPSPPLSSSSG